MLPHGDGTAVDGFIAGPKGEADPAPRIGYIKTSRARPKKPKKKSSRVVARGAVAEGTAQQLNRWRRVKKSSDQAFSYDDIAEVYAAGVDSRPYNALYERPAMLDLLPPVGGMRVLDAGCGTGWYAAELAARGAFVTAIDSSAAMIRHARERFTSPLLKHHVLHVELRVGDLEQRLSFASDASFDGIISSLALHYLRDWGPTLAEFRRILEPNGWLVFSTHHPAAEAIRLERPRYLDIELVEDYWKWVGTIRYYRRPLSAIVEALTNAGLAVERLVEPLPTDEFRKLKPDAYERLLRSPEFLLVRARPWHRFLISEESRSS